MSLPERFESRLRQMRTIVVTLAGGAAVFLVVVTVVAHEPAVERVKPLLVYVAVAVALGAVGARLTLPGVLRTQGRKQIRAGRGIRGADEQEKLLTLYQSEVILGAAILEGAALMGGVAYLIERTPLALGLGAALIGAILLWEFPTRSRLEAWLEEQGKRLHAGE